MLSRQVSEVPSVLFLFFIFFCSLCFKAGDYLPVETGRALWVQPPQDTWQLRAPATMHEAAGSTGG